MTGLLGACSGYSDTLLVREKQRSPRKDRCGDVERRQQRDEIVNAAKMEHDAEADRDQLCRGQPRTKAPGRDGQADERVRLDSPSPDAHPEIGEHAVEELNQEETDDDQLAKPALPGIPPFPQMRPSPTPAPVLSGPLRPRGSRARSPRSWKC